MKMILAGEIHGPAGTSRTAQAGQAVAQGAVAPLPLSTLSLGLEDGSMVTLHLRVFAVGRMIAEAKRTLTISNAEEP